MCKFTDIYSRRFPYFWGRAETKDIIKNFLGTGQWVFAKMVKTDTGVHKLQYLNLAMAFDIEDSSFYDQTYITDPEPDKVSTMYVWQFGIDNVVIMGRTWDEFIELCEEIQKYCDSWNRCIVYVHFFDHEFQFIRKLFKWDSVFSRKTRSPIYALTGGIEFRDSYILTGKNLAGVANDLRSNKGLKKKSGDLDYSKIRGCKTHLSRKEIGYCMADVQILNTCINEKISAEKNIAHIPLTNTGYVRRYVRKKCYPTGKKNGLNRKIFFDGIHTLTLTPHEYKMCKMAFQGGFTHANAYYSEDTITGRIDSIDFTSSYPTVMLSRFYPCSSGVLVHPKTQSELDSYLKDYLSIFIIQFFNIRPKKGILENIISGSKCWDVVQPTYNNGRLVQCISCKTCITNVDLSYIKKFYDYDYFYIGDMYIYEKGVLPKPIIESILDLYEGKTKLKGVSGNEDEYMLKKSMLNACYGMIVTDIVKSEINCNEYGEWCGETKPDLEKAIDSYNNKKNRFLFYPWGIFVTSWARANLYDGILEFSKNGKQDYIYSDTDSIKCLNIADHMQYINDYNKRVTDQIDIVLKSYNIDPERSRPKNIKGEKKQLGVWDWETEKAPYTAFKTLGAKRYMYTQNGEIHITVAGASKTLTRDYIAKQKDPYKFFDNDMYIESSYSGKLTHTYLDDVQDGTLEDYTGVTMHYHEESSVHLEPSSYQMNVLEVYRDYCSNVKKCITKGGVYVG